MKRKRRKLQNYQSRIHRKRRCKKLKREAKNEKKKMLLSCLNFNVFANYNFVSADRLSFQVHCEKTETVQIDKTTDKEKNWLIEKN